MRRPLVALALAIAVIGGFAAGLAWLLTDPRPPAGASRGERLYYAYCVECHGRGGRGSWRAALFLLRPGDLADPERMSRHTDQYLFDIVKHGGAPVGRPGMPAFGYHLSDEDIQALVGHVRTLAAPRPMSAVPSPAHLGLATLDAERHQAVAFRADGETDAVAGPQAERIDLVRSDGDRHLLHRRHAESGDGLVTDQDEVGGGSGDELALDFVGGGPEERSPQARRKGDQQSDEQQPEAPAGPGGGGQDDGVSTTPSPPGDEHRVVGRRR